MSLRTLFLRRLARLLGAAGYEVRRLPSRRETAAKKAETTDALRAYVQSRRPA